ncbi:MAG: hypothetical protein ACE5G2_05350 [Candidatus Krumholzibacteriia bacterium]
MNRTAFVAPVALLVALTCGRAEALPRSYLNVGGGVDVLTTNLDGDVVDERVIGQIEIGIGTHLADHLLLEATFGRLGSQQQANPLVIVDPSELFLPESELAYRVEVNPIMLRLRYAHSGLRSGYVKPEFHAGVGLYSVTRWMRPVLGLEPDTTNLLLPAFEVGTSALFVFDKNWMAYFGPRYTFMQRRDLVDETEHFDGLTLLLGFRFFLNSPREEYEPPSD